MWFINEEKSPISFEIFVKTANKIKIHLLPLELLSELARCFICASLFLQTIEINSFSNVANDISSFLLRILQHDPNAFESSAIRRCLEFIQDDDIISPSIGKLRSLRNFISLRCTLQLIKITLNVRHLQATDELIEMSETSDTVKATIFKETKLGK